MKRLLTLLVILIISGICPSANGLLLVYKVTSPVKGVNENTDAAVSVPLKGYLVMSFDDTGVFQDVNLLIYGFNSNREKVYYQLNDSDSDNLLDSIVWNRGVKTPYFFIGLQTLGDANPFAFEVCMWCKMTVKDIGFGKEHCWYVPVTLKGNITVWYNMLLDPNQDISGTGSITASLNKVTNQLNASGWTQDQAVELIVSVLEDSDYSPGTAKKSENTGEKFQTAMASKPALVRAEKKVNIK